MENTKQWITGRKGVFLLLVSAFMIMQLTTTNVNALPENWADHVVISEVYHSALNRNAQFLELYNPTSQPINLSGWAIQTELNDNHILFPNGEIHDVDVFIVSSTATIPAHGYYLIAGLEWDDNNGTRKDNASWPDADYLDRMFLGQTSQFFLDSGVILRNRAGNIVDAMGWGNASQRLPPEYHEGPTPANIVNVASFTYERKPAQPGQGNGIDTNNNANDFIIRTGPNPQNSHASIQPVLEQCNSAADSDCNGAVSNMELALYANLWYTNQGVTNIQLAIAAQAWFAG